jgi:metal-responsive CopG/Arc/MetJ family transcriptional regulator
MVAGERLKRLSVLVPQSMMTRLKISAARQGESCSQIIRTLVREFLAETEQQTTS